jgi:hypothetical protein
MATKRHTGNAQDVRDVWTFTPGGTIAAGSTFTFTIGTVDFVYTAGAGVDTVAEVTAELTEIWNSNDPAVRPPVMFRELQAFDNTTTMTLVARQYGVPVVISCVAGGSGSPTETFTNTTPATGRYFADNADNWSDGEAPANSDVLIFDEGSGDVLYGLTALSSLTGVTIQILPGYTGRIGLPEVNGSGQSRYAEYREKSLTLDGGTLDCEAPLSNRLRFAFGGTDFTATIRATGQRETPNAPALLLAGGDTATAVHVLKGDVGLAFFGGETAVVPTLNVSFRDQRQGDSTVYCGSGCTLTTITKSGGTLTTNSNITTFRQSVDGGITTHNAGTIATPIVEGGTLIYNSSGAIGGTAGPVVANDAIIDFDQSPVAKTLSNPIDCFGSRFEVRNRRGTVASFIVQLQRSDAIGNVKVSPHKRWTEGSVS